MSLLLSHTPGEWDSGDIRRTLAALLSVRTRRHIHHPPGVRGLPAYCGCCGCLTRYCNCSCCCQQ